MKAISSTEFAADLDNLAAIRHYVQAAATGFAGKPEVVSHLLLAVNEAVTNIIVHGYQGRPGSIQIEIRRRGTGLAVHLRDQAPPFNPTTVPPPDVTLPLAQRPPGGLGIHLIRQLMDEVSYRVTAAGGNELTLIKLNAFQAGP